MHIRNAATAREFVQSWLNPEPGLGEVLAKSNARRFHSTADDQIGIARSLEFAGHMENAELHREAAAVLRAAALALVPAASREDVEAKIMEIVDASAPDAADDNVIEHRVRAAGIESVEFYRAFTALKERGVIKTSGPYAYRAG